MDLLSSLKQHTGDDSEARELHSEIDAVIEEFTLLEAKAQAKQQRLKENRYILGIMLYFKAPNKRNNLPKLHFFIFCGQHYVHD